MQNTKDKLKNKIAPSILACNPTTIHQEILEISEDIDALHIDIMDGHFVPNHNGSPELVRAIKEAFPEIILDVHLMIDNPEQMLDAYIDAGADSITIHYESLVHHHRYLDYIRSKGVLAGLSLNPGTPVSLLENLITSVDVLLLMSVNPGFGGQSFIPEIYNKIEDATKLIAVKSADTLIEIDGGVKTHNAQELWNKGVDFLVAGSAVFGQENPKDELRKLSKQ